LLSGIILESQVRFAMYYLDIFKALSKHKVRYLVAGGVAMNLHGIPRMTADLDIMLDLSRANLGRFIKALGELGYKPKAPVDIRDLLDPAKRKLWSDTKNMVVFTLLNPALPYQELDVFIKNPLEFGGAYKKRTKCRAGGLFIPVVSIDDLIVMKEAAGRKQDKSDIPALKKLDRL